MQIYSLPITYFFSVRCRVLNTQAVPLQSSKSTLDHLTPKQDVQGTVIRVSD